MGRQQTLEVSDFLRILRRRKLQFFLPFILILIAGIGLAFGLPPVYRSDATILIERQEIPADLVQTTVTGFVEERIKGITERLLTRDNLWKIAEEQNLYPGERTKENQSDIVQHMRESVFVEMVDVQTNDPGTGKQSTATIAFTVGFEANDPTVALTIANELTTLFLEANRKSRSEQAAQVESFFEVESQRLSKEISALEAKLAEFKQREGDRLPELRDMNTRLYEKTEGEIDQSQTRIRSLEDTINSVRAELAITQPNLEAIGADGKAILSPIAQLRFLMGEYLRLSSIYSPDHPDLVKMRREIGSLEQQTGGNRGISTLFAQVATLRSQLSQARQKYTEEHPDVKKLSKAIATAEAKIRVISASISPQETGVAPDNPQYVALKTQLDAAAGNLKAEKSKLTQLQAKLEEYEKRIYQTPAVERDYNVLSRDYENARKKYNELKDKQIHARLAEQLESGSQAERFTVIQPATLPRLPDRPNRLGIALLSGFLAFSGGIGSVSVAEYLDQTIRGSSGIIAVFQAPPLAVIPLIQVKGKGKKKRA
jgi:uncharacterized protein involved in exopolysaccharide biosynthesis